MVGYKVCLSRKICRSVLWSAAGYAVLAAACVLAVPLLRGRAAAAQTTHAPSAGSDFLIVPGQRVGPIRAATTVADLRRIFGAAQVIDKSLPGPEGEDIDATLVYPRTPDRLEVFWTDKSHRRIGTVRTATHGSHWRIGSTGVSVGMPLSDLISRNGGKPIRFSGFDWDYGGYVSDWGGGALGKVFGGTNAKTTIRLNHPDDPQKILTAKQYGEISGEQQVSSTAPALRALRPFVGEITINF